MRMEQTGPGLVVYEKEAVDYRREDLERVALLAAQGFDDVRAAQVPNLFPAWAPGTAYAAGARVTDGAGRLYRVVQAHTSQADWPLAESPALYAPLGVTAADPEAVPEWVQPSGAQDAYGRGAQVKYGGQVWESLLDGNIWAPDAYPAGWAAARS